MNISRSVGENKMMNTENLNKQELVNLTEEGFAKFQAFLKERYPETLKAFEDVLKQDTMSVERTEALFYFVHEKFEFEPYDEEMCEILEYVFVIPEYLENFLENYECEPYSFHFNTFLEMMADCNWKEEDAKECIKVLAERAFKQDFGENFWKSVFSSSTYWYYTKEIQEYIHQLFVDFCEKEEICSVEDYLEEIELYDSSFDETLSNIAKFIIEKELCGELWIEFLFSRTIQKLIYSAEVEEKISISHEIFENFLRKNILRIEWDGGLLERISKKYQELVIRVMVKENRIFSIINSFENRIWVRCLIHKISNRDVKISELVSDCLTSITGDELLTSIADYVYENNINDNIVLSNIEKIECELAEVNAGLKS